MILELPRSLNEYWGKHKQTPMLLLDSDNKIEWFNDWSTWLFQQPLENTEIRQLQSGDILEDYVSMVRNYQHPPSISMTLSGVHFQVTGHIVKNHGAESVLLKLHTYYMSSASMLETFRLMQDFALEAGDRVNNPLTTVLNCLHILKRGVAESDPNLKFYELAIREANVMKDFGDWVRHLSNEMPVITEFDLVATIREAMDCRGIDWEFEVFPNIPPVIGSHEHALAVLGGMVSLIKQATGKTPAKVRIFRGTEGMVYVTMVAGQETIKDLRMLTEEFYGGLGLMAARYLLSMMQAHLDLDYGVGAALKITFFDVATKKL